MKLNQTTALRAMFFFMLLAGFTNQTRAQDAQRVAISTTGCTVDVFCLPGRFDVYDLDDGSTVFADDCEKDGIAYGIYCIRLKEPISDLVAAEDSMILYLDFLKADFNITSSKGYNKGHTLKKNPDSRGIFDTWEDADANKWNVKAWTNGSFICVLYVHSSKEVNGKKTEIFLEGLRFPGQK